MPSGTHLGESRDSQSSEGSQSVLALFRGWVRPGVCEAVRSRTTRKGLCSIGIYEKPAAGVATGLLADSDGLSNPKTGGERLVRKLVYFFLLDFSPVMAGFLPRRVRFIFRSSSVPLSAGHHGLSQMTSTAR
jgi:hypothetical protein